MSKYDFAVDIKAAKKLISEFNSNLPKGVDPASISLIAKIPFKAIVLRETLLYRIAELGETAIELYEKRNRITSAFLITRAVHETTALLYWSYYRMERVVDNNDIGDFDKFIMKVLMGWKKVDKDTPMESYNILTAIDKIDKISNGSFRKVYDLLSEYCHPNYLGVYSLYGKTDHAKIMVDLGSEKPDNPEKLGLHSFVASLILFKMYYSKTGDLLIKFIQICENAIKKTP